MPSSSLPLLARACLLVLPAALIAQSSGSLFSTSLVTPAPDGSLHTVTHVVTDTVVSLPGLPSQAMMAKGREIELLVGPDGAWQQFAAASPGGSSRIPGEGNYLVAVSSSGAEVWVEAASVLIAGTGWVYDGEAGASAAWSVMSPSGEVVWHAPVLPGLSIESIEPIGNDFWIVGNAQEPVLWDGHELNPSGMAAFLAILDGRTWTLRSLQALTTNNSLASANRIRVLEDGRIAVEIGQMWLRDNEVTFADGDVWPAFTPTVQPDHPAYGLLSIADLPQFSSVNGYLLFSPGGTLLGKVRGPTTSQSARLYSPGSLYIGGRGTLVWEEGDDFYIQEGLKAEPRVLLEDGVSTILATTFGATYVDNMHPGVAGFVIQSKDRIYVRIGSSHGPDRFPVSRMAYARLARDGTILGGILPAGVIIEEEWSGLINGRFAFANSSAPGFPALWEGGTYDPGARLQSGVFGPDAPPAPLFFGDLALEDFAVISDFPRIYAFADNGRGPYAGIAEIDDGWRFHDQLGWAWNGGNGWVWRHPMSCWVYFDDRGDDDGFYAWDAAQKTWLYSRSEFTPWAYNFAAGEWQSWQ